jgi:Ca2+-binding EF-hand superfamily protein
MKIHVIALGILCAGVLGLATAQAEDAAAQAPEKKEGDKPKMNRFEALDKDGNGTLSLDEFKVAHEKKIEMMKKKGGAAADKPMPTAEEAFAKIDADKDGAISKEEMAGGRHEGGKRGKKAE